MKLLNSTKLSSFILAFLFLPGTIIHELAHYLMAVVLRVRTTSFSLLPQIGSDSIVLGGVGIIKPDPIRRFFIGIAPLVLGLVLLFLGVHYFFAFKIAYFSYLSVGFFYCLFTLSNNMFSSSKDMEGAAELLLIVGLLVFFGYILGLRLPSIDPIATSIQQAIKLLLIPLGLDLSFLIIIKILLATFKS